MFKINAIIYINLYIYKLTSSKITHLARCFAGRNSAYSVTLQKKTSINDNIFQNKLIIFVFKKLTKYLRLWYTTNSKPYNSSKQQNPEKIWCKWTQKCIIGQQHCAQS